MSLSLKPTIAKDYEAAVKGVAYYVVPEPGYVQVSGDTRRDYLQRQTTNDLDLLTPMRALPTILTSPSGRILEVFTLIENGDAIGLLTQPGHGPGLAAYFQKRVFFNDNVSIEDQSARWAQIEMHGPGAAAKLNDLGFAHTPALDEIVEADWQKSKLRAIGRESLADHPSFHLILPVGKFDQLTNRLVNDRVESLSDESLETLRIEAGLPGTPEFNQEYTPFEVGLDRLVSAEKGCYTGQEVLARQVTYDKVVRHLVQLRAEHPLQAGAAIHAEGKNVGQITSAARSPRLGRVALAMIRKPYDQPGTQVEIKANGVFSAFTYAV